MSSTNMMLKLNTVMERTALSRSSIYQFVKEGKFPKSCKIGERSVAWVSSEIDQWLAERAEQRGGK